MRIKWRNLELPSRVAAERGLTDTYGKFVAEPFERGFGITVGNLITFPSLIIQREFPAASFALVANLATAVMGLTYALAPGVLGILRDATGGYAVPLYVCIATELLVAAIVLARVKAR